MVERHTPGRVSRLSACVGLGCHLHALANGLACSLQVQRYCNAGRTLPYSISRDKLHPHTLSFGHYDRQGRLRPLACSSVRLMCIIMQTAPAACIIVINPCGWGKDQPGDWSILDEPATHMDPGICPRICPAGGSEGWGACRAEDTIDDLEVIATDAPVVCEVSAR